MTLTIRDRIQDLDWTAIRRAIDEEGYAKTPQILTAAECRGLVDLWVDEGRFRSRVDMARYRFGIGEYKYLADPLPPLVQELRSELYPHLAAAANQWMKALGVEDSYPNELPLFLERCRQHGQTKPTPLILRYETDGYNCMHQDLYGDTAFPMQIVFGLCRRDLDYTGGEFLLLEQRPRAQSRGMAITIEQGEGVIFPTRYRPVAGTRGYYRVVIRHGVSRLSSGLRYTLGVIFHNAA